MSRQPTCRELCHAASRGAYCACDGYPLQVYLRDQHRAALAKATPDPKIFKPEPEPKKSVEIHLAPVIRKPKPQKQPKPRRPSDGRKSISVRGETYFKLKARAEVLQESMASIVSNEINLFLDAEDRKNKP